MLNSLLAILVVTSVVDGFRLRRLSKNGSVAEKRLARTSGKLWQANRSGKNVTYLEGGGKPSKAKKAGAEVEMQNTDSVLASFQQPFSNSHPPRRTIGETPSNPSRSYVIGAVIGVMIVLATLLQIFVCWYLCAQMQSNETKIVRRGLERTVTKGKLMTDDKQSPVYVTYWDRASKDPKRPWNPSEEGSSDGVQLAILQDGEVQRVPTDGVCTHHGNAWYKSKEWHHFQVKTVQNGILVVKYAFDAKPAASAAIHYREQYGVKEVKLGQSHRGDPLLAVGAIFETFHRKALDSVKQTG